MQIYVFGNRLVKEDSLPLRIIPLLEKEFPKIQFLEIDPSEDIMAKDKKMIILDTVINADKVCLIEDIDKIEIGKICSLHDFDLGYNLKLMKKFGMLDAVQIIGVPAEMDELKAVSEIMRIITSLSSGSA